MALFGLERDDYTTGLATPLHDALGLGNRQFSIRRNNAPFAALPDSFDVAAMVNLGTAYRNTMNQSKLAGTPAGSALHNPTEADWGGSDLTTFLPWNTHGDASDIHTPTGGNAFFNSFWRARKVDIANQVSAAEIAAGTKKPYLFSWCHEQRTVNASQTGVGAMAANGTGGAGTGAEFAASFRHVSAIMNDSTGPGALRDLGVVKMCCVPTMPQYMCEPSLPVSAANVAQVFTDKAAPYGSKVSLVNPGSAYVDMWGTDFYPTYGNPTPNQWKPIDVQNFWFCLYTWALQEGKPWVIGEWSSGPPPRTPTVSAAFASVWQDTINSIASFPQTGPGSCYGWCNGAVAFSATLPTIDDGSGIIQVVKGNGSGTGVVDRPSVFVFLNQSIIPVLNRVDETDLAQPVVRGGGKAIVEVIQTNIAQVVTRLKKRAVGQASEASLAQPVTRGFIAGKIVSIAQALTTEIAQAVTRKKGVGIAAASESEIALGVTRLVIGTQAVWDSTFDAWDSRFITWNGDRITPVVPPGGDLGFRLRRADGGARLRAGFHVKGAGPTGIFVPPLRVRGASADSRIRGAGKLRGSGFRVTGGRTFFVNPGLESEIAQPLGVVKKQRAIAQATETDVSQVVSHSKAKAIRTDSEAELELDTTAAVTFSKARAIARPIETDIAQPVVRVFGHAIREVEDVQFAKQVTAVKSRNIGQTNQPNLAGTMTPRHVYILGLVTEIETARPVAATTSGQTPGTDVITIFLRAHYAPVIRLQAVYQPSINNRAVFSQALHHVATRR